MRKFPLFSITLLLITSLVCQWGFASSVEHGGIMSDDCPHHQQQQMQHHADMEHDCCPPATDNSDGCSCDSFYASPAQALTSVWLSLDLAQAVRPNPLFCNNTLAPFRRNLIRPPIYCA